MPEPVRTLYVINYLGRQIHSALPPHGVQDGAVFFRDDTGETYIDVSSGRRTTAVARLVSYHEYVSVNAMLRDASLVIVDVTWDGNLIIRTHERVITGWLTAAGYQFYSH